MQEGTSSPRLTRRQVLRRAFAWGGGAIASSTALAACTGQPIWAVPAKSTPDPQSFGKVTLALSADLTTTDPQRATVGDQQILRTFYDRLLSFDERLNITPQLATSWEVSADGRAYTLRLAEGVKFHDGTAFDAEAVRINIERLLDPRTNSPWRAEIEPLIGAEVTDQRTIVLKLDRPYVPLLASLADRAGMMISPQAIRDSEATLALAPIGSGPFYASDWKKGNHFTVRRNPAYWQVGLPYLDEITFQPIADASQRLTALKANQVQMIDQIAWQDIRKTARDATLVQGGITGLGFQYIGLQTATFPFNDQALRQAVAWSLDRSGINKLVYAGAGVPAQTPISPTSWAYDPTVQVYKQDYELAKRKLAEAGRPGGFSFTMLTVATPEAQQLAEAYQQQLARTGITVSIEGLEFDTLLARISERKYEAVSLGWSGSPDPDGNLYPHFHSRGGVNYSLYHNTVVDNLLDQARTTAEIAERRRLYTQVTALIAEEAPMIFVRFPAEITCWQPKVHGVNFAPNGLIRSESLRLRG